MVQFEPGYFCRWVSFTRRKMKVLIMLVMSGILTPIVNRVSLVRNYHPYLLPKCMIILNLRLFKRIPNLRLHKKMSKHLIAGDELQNSSDIFTSVQIATKTDKSTNIINKVIFTSVHL